MNSDGLWTVGLLSICPIAMRARIKLIQLFYCECSFGSFSVLNTEIITIKVKEAKSWFGCSIKMLPFVRSHWIGDLCNKFVNLTPSFQLVTAVHIDWCFLYLQAPCMLVPSVYTLLTVAMRCKNPLQQKFDLHGI